MTTRVMLGGLIGLATLAIGGFGIWLATLPADVTASPQSIAALETATLLEQLQPRKRKRPVIAVIGINDSTETTDYLMPTGILRRADVADVYLVATQAGPVRLFPALSVEPDMTIAAFDAAYPDGADYVIVPAMSREDDPVIMAWLRSQAAKGGMINAVCVGARVVGAAGLLDGRQGTTHWFSVGKLLRQVPTLTYVANRRIVVDGRVSTTTGISASMPMALMLVEAIAGREKALEVARDIGLERWDASHDSGAFRLNRRFALTVIGNLLRFWQREEVVIPIEPGVDEVSLALAADAWSRTYRSHAITSASSASPVVTASGIRVIPDRAGSDSPEARRVSTFPEHRPAGALAHVLDAIAARYGERTSDAVALQLETARQSKPQA